MTRFFVRDEHRCGLENLDDEFNRIRNRCVVNAGSRDGDRVVAWVQSNGHGQLNNDGGFAIPCVENRGLVCSQRRLQTPVALSDGQVVLLVVVSKVVQVQVEGFSDAVSGAAEGVLFSHEVDFSQDGHLDISNEHIRSKERGGAGRTRCSKVPTDVGVCVRADGG